MIKLTDKRAALALATFASSLALAACGGGDEPEPEPAPQTGGPLDLVIGNSVPLSGDLEDFGPAAKEAAKLAIEEIEAAIEKNSSKDAVNLVSEDNKTDPAKTLETIGAMVDGDGASCVVGPWTPAETLSVAREIAIPEGILLISPAATLDEISTLEDRGLVNRTVAPDSAQGGPLADAIADDLDGAKGKQVAIGARSDAYGEALVAAFKSAWEEKGGKVAAKVLYDPERDDFDATAKDLTKEEADALVLIDFPEGFEELAKALDRTGEYDPEKTWSVDLLASTDLAKDMSADLIEGMRGTVPGIGDDDEAANAFAKLFSENADDKIERASFDAQTFDAVVLCYLAAVAARSTDGELMAAKLAALSAPDGKKITWEELPKAVAALERGKEIDYEGASGPIDLDASGDPSAGVYDIYSFTDGKLVLTDERPLLAADQKP